MSGTVASAVSGSIHDIGAGAAERLVANSFDASESKADIVARFSTNIDAKMVVKRLELELVMIPLSLIT